ncbi:MAG: NAD(P)-dependent glycerol-3-phosphate dehydrogenase, partial [Clostridia bacterium]|nr:NAD(P)-dependent glycerol-3-phosphate dehydrogenase [Clostridia bacterium]
MLISLARVAILGSGSWGCALAHTLSKQNTVVIWSFFKEETESLITYRENVQFLPGVKLEEGISFTSDLQEAVTDADFVVFAVPSFAIRQTAKNAAAFFVPKKQIAVCVAKGMEEETLFTLSEVIADELPEGSHVCALSGPTHAEEVGKDLPTTIVAACEEEAVCQSVQEAFMNENFRVYTSTDVKGVELGGTVKNIIALCAGISDGCGFGDNTKAALMTRGMYEIAKLGVAMGGTLETFFGLSGMGD